MKPDRPFGFFRFFNQPLNRLEHNFELMVVFLFHRLDFFFQVFVRGHQFPKLHECPHDLNVHLNRPFAVEYAGKHENAVLGEGERQRCGVSER